MPHPPPPRLRRNWSSLGLGLSTGSVQRPCIGPRVSPHDPDASLPDFDEHLVRGFAQGVMAYVILRPLMTLIAFIASLLGVLGDGEFRFDRVYIYTAFVNNFSQVGPHDRLDGSRPNFPCLTWELATVYSELCVFAFLPNCVRRTVHHVQESLLPLCPRV